MAWKDEYQRKLTTAMKAVQAIKSGNRVVAGHAYGQPQYLIQAMMENKEAYEKVEIVHMVSVSPAPYCQQENRQHFIHNSFFAGVNSRQAINGGWGKFTPVYFKDIPRLFTENILPVDVTLCMVSPPNEEGNCSFGVSVDYTKAAAESSKTVIAQVNRQMPRVQGNASIHVSRIDHIVEQDEPLLELFNEKSAPKLDSQGKPIPSTEQEIGRYCAELIEDGSCLQLGIGSLPDAVLPYLEAKSDLGIHTEMFSDGVVELVNKGVINGSKKNINKGKLVASFLMGTRKLYDFAHENPLVEMYPVDYTNDPYIIGQNDKVVSLNSCIQVDLLGQAASDTIGTKQFSGVGGQVDFIRGAARSKGGKSILAFPSTASGGKVSRIVPLLDKGAVVSTSRYDVQYIVTEYGIADLRGKSVKERAKQLIAIAHPDFRKRLEQDLELIKIL